MSFRIRSAGATAAVLAFGIMTCATMAGIPEPSFVLHGTLAVDGQTIKATDGVTILARVDGVAEPVGTYQMGDNPAARDNYVLRIRLESLADGSGQSGNAAVVGQTAHIMIDQGVGPQRHAADVELTAGGAVVTLDLSVRGGITWHRAVYYDERYPSVWTSGTWMLDHLVRQGYTVLDADVLKAWMIARIADNQPSVVVFVQDAVPDTVAETMTPDCTLRQYLNAGGKVVWYADIPLFYQGHVDGTTTGWGVEGSMEVLGFNAAGGDWESGTEVSITGGGLNWGLTRTWLSQRPAEHAGLRALAHDGYGDTAAWVMHYVEGDTYRGFVRFFDRWGRPNGHDVRQLAVFGNQLPPPLDNDYDGDEDVDARDLVLFDRCFDGPEATPTPPWAGITVHNCLATFDSDEDADVDLADFAGMQNTFTGSDF